MKGWMGKVRALFLLSILSLILSGCGVENLSAFLPKGYGAEVSLDIIFISLAVMIFVFIIVMVIYTIVLVKYRQKKGQEDFVPKQTEGNHILEIVWTVIPIILLIVIAVPTIAATYDLADETDKGDSLNINVTGNQYWWHFNYSEEEIQTSQDMYIPVGQKVYLNMMSSDVLHSFWVPAISGKMDTNPENENTMYIEAYEEGVYWGKCAELCGPSHSLMDFKIVVVSQEEFDQWVSDMQNLDAEATPETASAQEGQALFEQSCLQCHAIGSNPVAIGPNLTNFGDRSKLAGVEDLTHDMLVEWILDPESIKPGNKMTGNYDVPSKDEAEKIADYLLQLKPSEITPESASE
ncbi:cytochrome c oxidase subunit II [Aquibacillus koreensis]|uniref:Cytochrome c oxidase subunit 2 n=1 Tax=Aquibacillus koreensis TaxID=279446 RepID=A0A9X3WL59_9BACI|nr:cytochrome c oxidase subunit II [Aquibacillus koreensis]MCT2538095.1 cytochrome c oxidase subunit II [Aquibacillus koreensis]MDC3420618.1 cytochrome c oxidase subunit II [Aquibacillus koreensis]